MIRGSSLREFVTNSRILNGFRADEKTRSATFFPS
jgi:hypothetical protein